MNVVIQCAGGKRPGAGHLLRRDGRPVIFVADPAHAPQRDDLVYVRPDDLAEDGRSWRKTLLDYNRAPGSNPLKLLPASSLYRHPAYGQLVSKFGIEKIFILSAGWGLIPAWFLTPAYDITFKQNVDRYKVRRKADSYRDLSLFTAGSGETLVFLGGKDYLPFFDLLTRHDNARRIVFYNSETPPVVPGCTLQRYTTKTRTNWHYQCAKALISGQLALRD